MLQQWIDDIEEWSGWSCDISFNWI